MWDLFDESSTWGTDKDDGAAVGGMFGDQGSVSWHQRALCAQTDPEAFFPEKGGSVHEAKMVCAECEVRQLCLKWAIDNDERFGIWGGMSERERRRYKKNQA